jgi:hypothetical protein
VDGHARLPVVALRIENLPLVGVECSARAKRRDALAFEVANATACAARKRGLDSDHCSAKAAASDDVRRLLPRQLNELGVEPPAQMKSENSWRAGRGINFSTSPSSG